MKKEASPSDAYGRPKVECSAGCGWTGRRTPKTCKHCGATGIDPEVNQPKPPGPVPGTEMGGYGDPRINPDDDDDESPSDLSPSDYPCPECDGSGYTYNRCSNCGEKVQEY